jgi:hypothetical protein
MAGAACNFLLALGLLLPAAEARAAEPVADVALVLAVDSSSSVDPREFLLQMRGFAAAFRDPDVQEMLTGGGRGRVAVTLMEWSNPGWQRPTVPWRLIASPQDAEALAREIEDAPRLVDGGGTAIGNAVDAAVRLLRSAPSAARRVIDVSGDGKENMGRQIHLAREAAAQAGIEINALAIRTEEPDLDRYFEENLITGPAAFVQDAASYDDFAVAIRLKLLRELQGVVARMPSGEAPSGG